MAHIVVDAERYNAARRRLFPALEAGQPDTCSRWLHEQGVRHEHIFLLDFDLDAHTLTIYRYACWPYDSPVCGPLPPKGSRFMGYYQDGRWVADRNWPHAAIEYPVTVPYQMPPPQWVLDAGIELP